MQTIRCAAFRGRSRLGTWSKLHTKADRDVRGDLIALLLAGLCLGGFWAWTLKLDPSPAEYIAYPAHEYFPLMVEGWLQGRLDIPLPVPAGLLELSDPFDPDANNAYRLAGEFGIHDLSFYRGRLYTYWGPTPALVAFLPWRLLTGSGLSTAWAVWAFTLSGWLFASMMLLHVIRRFFPQTGMVVRTSALVVVGLGNFAAVVLPRASVYEVSIAAAYAFTSLAWWQLALALWRPPESRATALSIASLAFGLAVASRPSWVVVAPVLGAALWDVRTQWRLPLFRMLAVRAMMPIMSCILALLLLNFVRFDDPLEFGMRYQLMGRRPPAELFSLQNIPFSVVMYLLALPGTTDYFPFVLPSVAGTPPPGNWGSENVFGLFPLLPILGLCAFVPMAFRRSGVNKLVVTLIAGFACVLGILSTFFVVIMRYELDLAPMLALLAAIGLLLAEDRWRGSLPRRCAFRTFWGVTIVVTFTMTFLAVCSHQPRRSSPTLSQIAMWSNAMALHAGWSADSFIERLEIELKLPTDISPQREEVILATGQSSYHNDIYLRRPDAGHVVVGVQGGNWKRAESDLMALDETEPHTLLLEFGCLYPPPEHPYWSGIDDIVMARMRSRILVMLDSEILLDGYWPQWTSASATPVFGDLPGGSGDKRRFTGALLRLVQKKRSLK